MNETHGESTTRLYRAWLNMKDRCTNTNYHNFQRYGGRGISVCSEWINSYEAFREWSVANGYKDNLSLDRIDGDLGYLAENCRWANDFEQARNRSNNKLTAKDVPVIKTMYGAGFSQPKIADIFKISQTLVSRVVNGKRWA